MILYDFQYEAAKWLSDKKVALLSLDCGLGKTLTSLQAAKYAELKSLLVLCPKSITPIWQDEVYKWGFNFPIFDVRAYSRLTNIKDSYDLIILDEAHYLKNLKANRTQNVLGKEGLVRRGKRVWALTATPMPNNASELWPLLFTFGRTKLNYDEWVKEYCTFSQKNPWAYISGTKKEKLSELKAMLSEDWFFRRVKSEVAKEMPPISYHIFKIEAGSEEDAVDALGLNAKMTREDIIRGLAKDAEKMRWALRDEDLTVADSLMTIRRLTGLRKAEVIGEIVKKELEANTYEKICIFAHHKQVISILETALKDFCPLVITGETSEWKRNLNAKEFEENDKRRVFLGNIQASGTGLSFSQCHQVLFVESDFTPANNYQAAQRCHRITTKKPVTVRIATIDEYMDNRIQQILARKIREISEVVSQ